MEKVVATNLSYQLDPHFPPDREEQWDYPPERDGSVHAHNALRGEITDYKAALAAMTSRGEGLKEWELHALKKVFEFHIQHIKNHHHHEDMLFAPEFKKRFKYPEQLEVGHEEIDEHLKKMEEIVSELRVGSNVGSLLVEWETYETVVRQRLQKEDDMVLPLQRAYFTPKEISVIVEKLMKAAPQLEMGAFFYYLGEQRTREEFMPQEKIPWFVWFIAFRGAYKQYVRQIAGNVDALKSGVEPKNSWYSLFWN